MRVPHVEHVGAVDVVVERLLDQVLRLVTSQRRDSVTLQIPLLVQVRYRYKYCYRNQYWYEIENIVIMK